MNIILLSGGSGKRLWPLSNDVRSKQFLKIFKTGDSYESMVQRVYRQINSIDNNAIVTIATSKSQASAIKNQLGDNVNLSVEPTRKDTFPAISLAVAYMHDVLGIDRNESVAVCPVDHYVDTSYYKAVEKICDLAKSDDSDLILLGIEPNCPSDKYGYIIPSGNDDLECVKFFKEKPTCDLAEEYISKGALWNAGVFSFKLKFVLDKTYNLFGFNKYNELLSAYSDLPRISFDYAIVEKTKKIKVLRYNGIWRDIGSWSMLTRTMSEKTVGNVTMDSSCCNSHIINNLDIPVLCIGLKDITVAAAPDGILVAENNAADKIKDQVSSFDYDVMYAEKSWGDFHVLDISPYSLTIKVTMKANDNMTYHSHDNRDEIWTVVSGQGKTIVDGNERSVSAGDVIVIKAQSKHTIFSITDLVLIEVQIGKDISSTDKHKFELP